MNTQIGKPWSAINSLDKIWKAAIENETKIMVFKASVEIILLYSSKSWTLNVACAVINCNLDRITYQSISLNALLLKRYLCLSLDVCSIPAEVFVSVLPSSLPHKRLLNRAEHCIPIAFETSCVGQPHSSFKSHCRFLAKHKPVYTCENRFSKALCFSCLVMEDFTPKKLVNDEECCYLCDGNPRVRERIKIFGKSGHEISNLINLALSTDIKIFSKSNLFVCYKRFLKS